MSSARITYVDKARKRPGGKPPHTCGKCGDPILPGTSYLWYAVGFRARPTFRCRKSTCAPKGSELESSAVADILAAIEEAEDQVDELSEVTAQEFESAASEILQSVQDAIEEVASTYEEADQSMGGNQATEAYERAETLRGNDLGSFSLNASDPEGCGDEWKSEDDDADADDHEEPQDGCDFCQTKLDDWLEEARQEVRDALDEVELP